MKVLGIGQHPHFETDYIGIEIVPGHYIAWDHLGGFHQNYRSDLLDVFESGIVHTEYLFPDAVKQQYPNLDLRFDAVMMIHNNHFDRYYYFINEPPPKSWTNFVSTLNKGMIPSRVDLLLLLHKNGWFDPKYCSKFFEIKKPACEDFYARLRQPMPDDIDNFCRTTSAFYPAENGNIQADFAQVGPRIQKSFIHIVTETAGNSSVVFPTEKFLLPTVNKTLWLAYAQPGYHKFIETYIGFKQFENIDYSFDSIKDDTQRLLAIEQVLTKLYNMSLEEQQELYLTNQHILDYNWQLIKTGKFIENLLALDQATPPIKDYRQRLRNRQLYREYLDILI